MVEEAATTTGERNASVGEGNTEGSKRKSNDWREDGSAVEAKGKVD